MVTKNECWVSLFFLSEYSSISSDSIIIRIAFTQELPRLCPFLKQINLTACERINDAGLFFYYYFFFLFFQFLTSLFSLIAVAPVISSLRRLRRIYLNACPVSEPLLAAVYETSSSFLLILTLFFSFFIFSLRKIERFLYLEVHLLQVLA